ncbi:MAG: D-alanyl-D-alanine carboxypeptidase [Clostridia bacterium]|nr:D-alanyl-D-alanine carboxypeptidase [Clostridia bacterium]
MRKNFSIFFIVLAFVLSFSVFFSYTMVSRAFAENLEQTLNEDVKISSKSSILIDAESGTVLNAYNENAAYPIASMCKIMTLLLCFESVDSGDMSYNDTIVVSETAACMGGSQVFLEAGAEYTANELLKSITVASANDACVAMAETICGSEDVFVEKMNEKAKSLGMDNTVFVNCTGLPKAGQHSSAKDVSKMFSELIKHKDYFRFSTVWMDEIKHPEGRITEISNTNKLIRYYKGCDSGKTGYTSEAGHCLCASAVRDGLRLISVVISAPDSKTRFKEVSSMFNYGFANYESKTVIDNESPLDFTVSVKGGKKSEVSVIGERAVKVLNKKHEKRSFELDFIPDKNVKAPVYTNDIIGVLDIYENGVKIDSVAVKAAEDIKVKTYFDILSDISANWSVVS